MNGNERTMRMFFEPEETEEFEAAKELLGRRFERWARGEGHTGAAFVVGAAMDFRRHSIDGRLGFWTAGLVRDFLLNWIPLRVSATAEDMARVPEELRSLLRYLHHVELADPACAPLPELEAALDAAAVEFPDAMADESRFGLAKFWTMRAMAAGIDPSDGEAVMRFSQRADVDTELLDQIVERQLRDGGNAAGQAPPQLPITLPVDTELADAAACGPLVERIRALVGWVGESGRPLTTSGNIKLADARELVELLHTDDTLDPAIGARTFRTKSSTELNHLTLIVELAKKARLVRVVKNRLVRIARARRLFNDPLALWGRLFTAICEARDAVVPPDRYFGPSLLYFDYDETIPDMLNSIYGMPESMPVLRLEEPIWQEARETYTIDDAEPRQREAWRDMLHRDLLRALAALAELGAVELSVGNPDPVFSMDLDDDPEPDAPSMPVPDEARKRLRDALAPGADPVDLARLTPLGHHAVHRRLLDSGRYAPIVGELTGAGPAELLGTVAEHYTSTTGNGEITRWVAARGGENDAMPQLLDAVRRCPFRARAAAMFDVLTATRADRVGWLRALRTDGQLGPLVVNQLVRDGEIEVDELGESEGLRGIAEQFIQLLETGGQQAVEQVLGSMPAPEREDIRNAVLRSAHPDTTALDELCELAAPPQRPANVHPLAGPHRRRPASRPRKSRGRKR